MEPSSILDQIDRLRAQLPAETDRATRREMKHTIRFLHKQYRKAIRYRHPWYGLKTNVVVFVLIFLTIVLLAVHLERKYGWQNTTFAFIEGFVVILFATATILLSMKLISQETYATFVRIAADKLPWNHGSPAISSDRNFQTDLKHSKMLEGSSAQIPALDAGTKNDAQNTGENTGDPEHKFP